MINYDDVPHAIHQRTKVTHFRRHMAHYITLVRYGDDYVCIKRRGMDNVYLVSQADFDLINKRRDVLIHGPCDPKTGNRIGRGFWHVLRDRLREDRGGED